jgi:uncharacterized membrane protein (UPF0127 family)
MLRSRLSFALAALLACAVAPAVAQTGEPERAELLIESAGATHSFQVEIADDPAERSRGLMFRREMADEHGMLFDFGSDQPASFWMQNTYIPLDMLFIESDGTIESIAERTTPLSQRSVTSRGAVRYVLEINGGLSDELGIAAGDKVIGPAIEERQ